MQDTYARVLARPRLVRRDDDVGYLLQVLRNTFVSSRRTAARRPAGVLADPPEQEAADTSAARQPHAALEAAEVYRAIAALPDDFRDALVAVDVVGLSYREAARAMRVPEGTLTSRLYRARRQVAHALEGGAGESRAKVK